MRPKAMLLFGRFVWSSPEGQEKPTKIERALPDFAVGELITEGGWVWQVQRIDSRGVWAVRLGDRQ